MQSHPLPDFATIESLKRQARRLRLEANRAPTALATQFIALAELYEVQVERLETAAA